MRQDQEERLWQKTMTTYDMHPTETCIIIWT